MRYGAGSPLVARLPYHFKYDIMIAAFAEGYKRALSLRVLDNDAPVANQLLDSFLQSPHRLYFST